MNSGEIRNEQTAKNFYEQLKELKTRINVAAMERRELESLKGSVYSPVYGDQVKRYPNSVALVERIDGMIEGISKKIYQYLELKTEARYILSKVPGAPEREVLILYFSGIWEKISNGANDAWEGVKSAFSHVSDWFKNVFSEAWQKVQDVFSEGGKIFNNIKEGIADTFKLVVNNIIDGINTVIGNTFEGVNNALSTIHEVEILGVKPFEWINPIDVPVIPKFATGAIVKAPTLAVVGDNPGAGSGNPEVIAPLNKLQSIINTSGGRADSSDAKIVDILTRIYETLMLQRNDNRQSESRTYEMNGEPVFKEMVRLNDEYKVRYGRSAFL